MEATQGGASKIDPRNDILIEKVLRMGDNSVPSNREGTHGGAAGGSGLGSASTLLPKL